MSELSAAPPADRASGRLVGGPASAATRATPGRSRNGWTLVLAGLGAFMSALDVVVVATALPTLQSHLGASLADLEWTINAYNLVFGCLMLTGAALGDRFGRRRMYVLGLIVFVLGSALAALSSGAGALIAARVVEARGRYRHLGWHHRPGGGRWPRRRWCDRAGPLLGVDLLDQRAGRVGRRDAVRAPAAREPRPPAAAGHHRHGPGQHRAVRADLGAGAGALGRLGQRRGDRCVRGRGRVPGRVPGLGTAGPVSDAAAGLLPPPRLRHRQRGDLLPVHLADRVPVLHHSSSSSR